MTRDEINEITTLLKDFEERISTRLADLETAILTASHESASPTEQRQRPHRDAKGAIDPEYEALRTRVRELEREWDAREENRVSQAGAS